MKELLFYDIECFRNDSLIVFKDISFNTVAVCWNRQGTEDTYGNSTNGFEQLAELIKNKVLAGYNNYYYDDRMITQMMNGTSQEILKKRNDLLINYGKGSLKINPSLKSIDIMQEIDVSRPSLKQIEGNMGMSIVESDVDFTIDRPLTQDEAWETEMYCEHDVDATIRIYKLRYKSYFQTKKLLYEMVKRKRPDLPDTAYRWNTTTLIANLLTDRPVRKWEALGKPRGQPYIPLWTKCWRKIKGIPEEVWRLWEQGNDLEIIKNQTITRTLFAEYPVSFVFGFGGLHGINASPKKKFHRVLLLDVASMYPTILINLQALNEATEDYAAIKNERLRIKHTDLVKSKALKLILNATYGLFKSEYSLLYNPKASSTVCVYGQMALFDLCRQLNEAGYEIINVNTDGVAFVDNNDKNYLNIWHQWEKDFQFTLELDQFDWWLQKDVNNYIAKPKDSDHIKVKGGETNKYYENRYFSNNNARIIQIALVDYLVQEMSSEGKRIPKKGILDFITDHLDDPLLFQYVLKCGSTFKGTRDRMHPDSRINKVNRVFAVMPEYADADLVKERMDGGIVKFPDAPAHMKLWNEDINEMDINQFMRSIDLNHYYQLVMKKLKGWI